MNKVYIKKITLPELYPYDRQYYFSSRINNKLYQVKLVVHDRLCKENSFKDIYNIFRECKNKLKYYIPPEKTE